VAVVFTFVLCQALHSDRKGKFPVFLRKNSIAYESMGRRLEEDCIQTMLSGGGKNDICIPGF
jgi:hypothetical protein